jgi:hypothetical protein
MASATSAVERANDVLFAACRIGGDPRAAVAAADLDWAYINRAASVQGVVALLHDWLQRHPEIVVYGGLREELHQAYWAGHFRNQLLLAELDRLRDAASRAGVDILPLKGAQLATSFYQAAALRPLGDLDLLVRPAQAEAMGEILRSLEYREVPTEAPHLPAHRLDERSRERCWTTSRDGQDVVVEYRTIPLELAIGRFTDLDRQLTAMLDDYTSEVWTRARRPAAGHGAWTMTPEDLLLLVTTHLAAKHLDPRLIWLRDVAAITAQVPGLDWTYVATRARRLRAAGTVKVALEAAAMWLGAPKAPPAFDALAIAPGSQTRFTFERWEYDRLRRLVSSLRCRDLRASGPAVSPLGSTLARVRGWRARLTVLRSVAWPAAEYLADRDPAGPIGYPRLWARRCARGMMRLSRSWTRSG